MKLKKYFRWCVPALLAVALIFSLYTPVSATELRPYVFAYDETVDSCVSDEFVYEGTYFLSFEYGGQTYVSDEFYVSYALSGGAFCFAGYKVQLNSCSYVCDFYLEYNNETQYSCGGVFFDEVFLESFVIYPAYEVMDSSSWTYSESYGTDEVTVDINIPFTAYNFVTYYDDRGYISFYEESESNSVSNVDFYQNQGAYYMEFASYILGAKQSCPYVIDVSDIKSGSVFDFSLWFDIHVLHENVNPNESYYFTAYWYMDDGSYHSTRYSATIPVDANADTDLGLEWRITVPAGARYVSFSFNSGIQGCAQGGFVIEFTYKSLQITFEMSDIEYDSKMYNDIVGKLDGIEDSISEGNEKLDGIQDSMNDANDKLDGIQDGINDTNDKLDDANDKLDEMPGEIGDEVQDIIDKEEQDALDQGDSNVGAVTDVIPDYSGDFATAMSKLASAVSYEGIEAKLPIPSLVLPAIDGMFPATEIWSGSDLDFGEYIQMLPENLMLLVQALFTIAAVTYCFYELYGLISYALTLKSDGRREDSAVG